MAKSERAHGSKLFYAITEGGDPLLEFYCPGSFGAPGATRDYGEVERHCKKHKEMVPGIQTISPFSVTCSFDPDQASHLFFMEQGMAEDPLAVPIKIVTPSGKNEWTLDCFIDVDETPLETGSSIVEVTFTLTPVDGMEYDNPVIP